MGTAYTIGHGSRSLKEFTRILTANQVKVLVDVRRYPGSRRYPHFGKAPLEEALRAAGIDYKWWGESMGGRRKADDAAGARHPAWTVEAFRAYAVHMETAEFQRALKELLGLANNRRPAVMCAEALWWRCHRRLIADALVAAGTQVVHLGAGRDRAHELTPWARIDRRGLLIYDGAGPTIGADDSSEP